MYFTSREYWGGRRFRDEGDGGGGGDVTAQLKALEEQVSKLTSGLETVAAERDRFKAKHGEAEKHLKEQEAAAKRAIEEAARKNGDVAALEKSWSEKYESAINAHKTEVGELNKILHGITVGAQASAIASELAIDGAATVLEPHIRSRLTMEMVDGKATVKVLDQEGRPSALTLDNLRGEFMDNAAFAAIIKGSSASGGGKTTASGTSKAIKRSAFDALSPMEQSTYIRGGGKVVD